MVRFNGNVTWLSTVIFKSSCSINVRYFPFDEQMCDMVFASWTFDGFFLDINVNSREGDLTNYIKNGEWHLVKLMATKNLKIYSCCEEPYPEIFYRLIIRRRPLYYVFNMVFPCLLITLVAFLGFYLPPGSTDKVSIGITTLLSITVFLMLVAESMPPTSEQLPLLGIYYAVTIGIVSFSTAMAVITLNINNKGNKGKRVPRWVKFIFLDVMAKILRTDIKSYTSRKKTKPVKLVPAASKPSYPQQQNVAYPRQTVVNEGGLCSANGGDNNTNNIVLMTGKPFVNTPATANRFMLNTVNNSLYNNPVSNQNYPSQQHQTSRRKKNSDEGLIVGTSECALRLKPAPSDGMLNNANQVLISSKSYASKHHHKKHHHNHHHHNNNSNYTPSRGMRQYSPGHHMSGVLVQCDSFNTLSSGASGGAQSRSSQRGFEQQQHMPHHPGDMWQYHVGSASKFVSRSASKLESTTPPHSAYYEPPPQPPLMHRPMLMSGAGLNDLNMEYLMELEKIFEKSFGKLFFLFFNKFYRFGCYSVPDKLNIQNYKKFG
jgi:hypothetical protein